MLAHRGAWPCQCISGYHYTGASARGCSSQPSLITPSHLTAISWSPAGTPTAGQQAPRCRTPSTIFRVSLANTEANRNTAASFCLPRTSWLPLHRTKRKCSQPTGWACWSCTGLCWKCKEIKKKKKGKKDILKCLKCILHNPDKM